MMNRWIVTLALLIGTTLAWAQSPMEKKAQDIEKHLIAPCCWSKTIDQEQSEVAIVMKQEIRRRLAAGQPVEQIYAAFENEFGERVLATPKVQGFNWTVWVFPFVIMILGTVLLVWVVRRSATKNTSRTTGQTDLEEKDESNPKDEPLSEKDQAYLKQMDQELYRP